MQNSMIDERMNFNSISKTNICFSVGFVNTNIETQVRFVKISEKTTLCTAYKDHNP